MSPGRSSGANAKQSDRRLLDAIRSFVASHPHEDLGPFRDGIADWGRTWRPVAPSPSPVTATLTRALSHTVARTHPLTRLFEAEKLSRRWEQSYTKSDGLVGDDMLAGYGFAEVIGKEGPFVSQRVRAGVGVWGPHIRYPRHRHKAEEAYVLLAGSAEFLLGEAEGVEGRHSTAGDVVFVPSLQWHGFLTHALPLVVLYIWQGGDLRERSAFS